MNAIIRFTLFLTLSSCIIGGAAKKASVGSGANSNGPTDNVNTTENIQIDKTESVRTFNEYNKALAVSTGVSPKITVEEYEAVKNKLPPTNDINKFSEFGQISATRLSFDYCDEFIETDSEFSNFDYSGNKSLILADMLMKRFLDYDPSKSSDHDFDTVKKILVQILTNEKVDGIPSIEGAAAGDPDTNKRLTKMGCTAILASAYYTVI